MKFLRDKAHCKHEGYTKEEIDNKTQANITTGGAAVKCGYQIDGKDVYVKRISAGALSGKTFDTGVPLTTTIIGFMAVAGRSGTNSQIVIPDCFSSTGQELAIYINFNGGANGTRNMTIRTDTDYSTTYDQTFITIWYINNN